MQISSRSLRIRDLTVFPFPTRLRMNTIVNLISGNIGVHVSLDTALYAYPLTRNGNYAGSYIGIIFDGKLISDVHHPRRLEKKGSLKLCRIIPAATSSKQSFNSVGVIELSRYRNDILSSIHFAHFESFGLSRRGAS